MFYRCLNLRLNFEIISCVLKLILKIFWHYKYTDSIKDISCRIVKFHFVIHQYRRNSKMLLTWKTWLNTKKVLKTKTLKISWKYCVSPWLASMQASTIHQEAMRIEKFSKDIIGLFSREKKRKKIGSRIFVYRDPIRSLSNDKDNIACHVRMYFNQPLKYWFHLNLMILDENKLQCHYINYVFSSLNRYIM